MKRRKRVFRIGKERDKIINNNKKVVILDQHTHYKKQEGTDDDDGRCALLCLRVGRRTNRCAPRTAQFD